MNSWAPVTRGSRALLAVALVAVVALLLWAVVLPGRHRDREIQRDLQIVQGVRKVCRLTTIEVSLADYSRRSLPKIVDLPFTTGAEAFLFYSGVIAAGFDACGDGTRIRVDHNAKTVEVDLPPPRILSLDIKRFEIINEHSGLLNTIEPADRNQWYQDARDSLKKGALASGILEQAKQHASELFGSFVDRWGFQLVLTFDGKRPAVDGRVPE